MKTLTLIKVGNANFAPTSFDLISISDLLNKEGIGKIISSYPKDQINVDYFNFDEYAEFQISYSDPKFIFSDVEKQIWLDCFKQMELNQIFTIVAPYWIDLKMNTKQISYCKRCNIQNEYIDFNPNWICYSCRS